MTAIKAPAKNPASVYTNQRVAIGHDLVFGWVVLTCPTDTDQAEWKPLSELSYMELSQVRLQADGSPLFPQDFYDVLQETMTYHVQRPQPYRAPAAPADFLSEFGLPPVLANDEAKPTLH